MTLAELVAAVEAVGLSAPCTRARRQCCERASAWARGWWSPPRSRRRSLRWDDPGSALRRLGVGRACADHAGRALGGLAVPSGHVAERPPRRGDDGHADLARDARRARLVGSRARRRPGLRTRTSRSRRSSPPSSCSGATSSFARGAAPVTRFVRCSSSARRTRACCATARRCSITDRASSSWATCSSSGPVRRSPPTASSSTAPPPSTSRC